MKLFNRLIVSAGERQTAEIQLLLQKERSQRMLRHNCQLWKSISLTVLLFVFNSILFHICHFPFFYILLCFIIGQIRELLKRNNLLVFLFAQSCSTGPFFTFLFLLFTFLYNSAMHRAPEKNQLASLITSRAQLLQLSSSSLAFLFLLATDSAALTINAILSFILSLC